MAGETRNGQGVDSRGNSIVIVAAVRENKVVTSAVRSTGNREQDEEKARRAVTKPPEDSEHLKNVLGGGS